MSESVNYIRYRFHVDGMHCASCVLITENEIGKLGNVSSVKSNLRDQTIEIVGDFEEKSNEEVANELTRILLPFGYSVSVEKTISRVNWSDFKIALPLSISIMLVFLLLQKFGLVGLIGGDKFTYGTAFVIGIVASLSTCMAIVGGLLLSISATFAKGGDNIKPQLMFHGGRLISFFLLGGIIGAIGSAFTLNSTAIFILSFFVGVVMFILGINLLDIFPRAKMFQLSMPQFISLRAHNISKYNHTLTPLFIGVASFFLPCGFTQSMQLYTLTTGNFMTGALTMFSFAVGTLPILLLISFSSFGIKSVSTSKIFFKTAGLVVIMFALINLYGSLVAIGIVPAIFSF